MSISLIFMERAIRQDDDITLNVLLRGGNIPGFRNEKGQSLLHLSAKDGNAYLTNHFIKAGCDVNSKDNSDRVPLEIAMKGIKSVRGLPVVKLLVEAGADVNVKSFYKKLLLACFNKDNYVDDLETAKIFLDKGADVHTKNRKGDTPLHKAAYYGKLESVEFLLDYGANPNVKNLLNRTPLHMAAALGSRAELTVEQFSDLSSSTECDCYVRDKSVQFEILKSLLEHGADANVADYSGKTPFHCILENGDEEDVRLFVDHGAFQNKRDNSGRAAVHYAAKNHHVGILNLIANLGCNLDERSKNKDSAMHIAAECGLMDNVEFLHGRGIKINCHDNHGCTPLYRLLMSYGNCEDPFDRFNYEELAELLVDLGANINARNKEGLSIIEIPGCDDFIFRFFAKMKFFGKVIGKHQLGSIKVKFETKLYFHECLRELAEINDFVFYGKKSILPIFLGSRKMMARYARNDELIEAFDSINVPVKFPIYGQFIEQRFAFERERTYAIDFIGSALPQKIQIKNIVEKIIDHLNTRDLVKSMRFYNHSFISKADHVSINTDSNSELDPDHSIV